MEVLLRASQSARETKYNVYTLTKFAAWTSHDVVLRIESSQSMLRP